MSLVDFSFSNSQIRDYFEFKGSYEPVSELIYVHSHPLVKPNFLDELEALILRADDLIARKNIRGAVIDKFTDLAIKLGAELPNISKENAPAVLSHLRELYKLCNGLLKNNNVVNT